VFNALVDNTEQAKETTLNQGIIIRDQQKMKESLQHDLQDNTHLYNELKGKFNDLITTNLKGGDRMTTCHFTGVI
jgi:carbonic anhydrase/acetyltransferase-like protein (isoleucine patch superfamily)